MIPCTFLRSMKKLGCCCCSVTKLRLTFCDLMDCSTPGFPVLHCIPELAQIHAQTSHPLPPSFPFAFNLSQHQGLFQWVGSFPVSLLFASGGQNIGASVSASVLPMNIQGWFPLGLNGLIHLKSKGLSRFFSITTVRKHQFFGVDPSLWSNTECSCSNCIISINLVNVDLHANITHAWFLSCFIISNIQFSTILQSG